MKKRIFSLALALVIASAFAPAYASSNTRSIFHIDPINTCIDYGVEEIILRGSAPPRLVDGNLQPVDLPLNVGAAINLHTETIDILSGYDVVSFSIDGGEKWRRVGNNLSVQGFPKLLNKGMTLHLSNKPPNESNYANDAVIVVFPAILPRPPVPRLIVNYYIDRDEPGEMDENGDEYIVPGPGRWVMAGRGEKIAREDVQIAAAVDRRIDDNGFGQFRRYGGKDHEGETIDIPVGKKADDIHGIMVKENKLTNGRGTVVRSNYFWRLMPREMTADSIYRPASRPRRVTVTSERNPPRRYGFREFPRGSGNIRIYCENRTSSHMAKYTFVIMNGSYSGTSPGEVPLLRQPHDNRYIPLLRAPGYSFAGEIVIWRPATERSAATAKQHIVFPAPPPAPPPPPPAP
jgi:hypothetical protein